MEKNHKTEEEWKKILTLEQYRIMREKGTEEAGCGVYLEQKGEGAYHCVACDLPLFNSGSKFESGTGWPSFFEPLAPDHLEYREDTSHCMTRAEVICARCESHLGHVFENEIGPSPTGKRYCINSIALNFKPKFPDVQ